MDLLTPLETICRLIVRARELEAQVPTNEPDDDDNDEMDPADSDDEFAELDDDANDVVEAEIMALLDDLGDDQVEEILALALVGRGTYDPTEWEDALEAAADPDSEDPVDQLIDMPTLAAYLDAGLAAFDLSCEGIGQLD
jgi:hypothetical protein